MSEPVETKQPSRRWRWVLGLSLALNLLFVGLVAGAMLRHEGPRGASKHGTELRGFGAPYMRALPREARRAMVEQLRAGGQLPDREDRRAAYAQMVAALRAQPFDPAAAEALVQAQADAMRMMQGAAQDVWLQQISDMSDADRAAYADRLEDRMRWGGRKGSSKDR